MRKITLSIVLIIHFCFVEAQLIIQQTYTPTQLVQDVLLGGGVTVSNVTYTGSPLMIGKFSGFTNVGLDSGILMGTGEIKDPNFGVNQSSYGFFGGDMTPSLPGDVDIQALSGHILTGSQFDTASIDACVLEFDFVPLGDTVKFRYVFGSEEYPDYVCSAFNDYFGFFISGPGISGSFSNSGINIATLPNGMPVAINTVNSGYPGSGNPTTGCQSLSNSAYYVNNTGATIAFNGFTTVLTAWAKVIACDTFHIKLAISDMGDGSFGSGVFLEANSFFSNGTSTSLEYTNSSMGSYAVEGCSDAILHINLGVPATSPITINYTVGGTATNGTDYSTIPASITIPIGGTADSIIIHPLTDGIAEGIETVTIILQSFSPCGAVSDTIKIFIKDNTPLNINLTPDQTICSGDTADLIANVIGGLAPYTYLWNNSAGNTQSVQVMPLSTTTYIVTVNDMCGQTSMDTVVVIIAPGLNIEVDDVTICPGQSATLVPSGASSYTWSGGLSGNPAITPPLIQTTTYSITGSTSGCNGSSSVTVYVDILQGDFSSSFPIPGNITTVNFTDLTTGSVQWYWDFGNGTTSNLQNPTVSYENPGVYNIMLIVTNANNCTDTIIKSIEILPLLEIEIPNVFSPNADGFNDFFGPVLSGYKSFHMEIFNRWGRLVFITDNYDLLWNGTINNNPASDGVYYYIISIGQYGLEDYNAKGNVTLIR
ncbi:MAG: choice-of-anchor L domain-containing protein [Bacteroidota bacterium]